MGIVFPSQRCRPPPAQISQIRSKPPREERKEKQQPNPNERTEDSIHLRLRVDRHLVRAWDRRAAAMGAVGMRIGVVRAEVHVRTRDALDAFDVCMDDRAAE